MRVSQSTLRVPKAMLKRSLSDEENDSSLEEDEWERLIKRPKEGQFDHVFDYHPSVLDCFAPTSENCRHCGEDISDHHYYTVEKYWDTMTCISMLRCDRKIYRSYFHKYSITSVEGKMYEYETFLDSHCHDTWELNEGRKTQ